VDPGVSTGLALVTARLDDSDRVQFELGPCTTLEDTSDILDFFNDLVVRQVIVEDFTLWPVAARKTSQNDPKMQTARVIGHVEALFRDRVTYQQPGEKGKCPDEMLGHFGLLRKGHQLHIRDAIRHVVIYTRSLEPNDFRLLCNNEEVTEWDSSGSERGRTFG
jgi:hypothetical protein